MGEDIASAVAEFEHLIGTGGKLHVLKHDDLFAVFDACGNFNGHLHAVGPSIGADGLFQDDTRILSRFTLRIQGLPPEVLSSEVGLDNVVFTAHLTNPSFRDLHHTLIGRSDLYLRRRRLLWQRKLYDALFIRNFAHSAVAFELSFEMDSDFRDVFEIRGMTRARRGGTQDPCPGNNCLTLAYEGLDGIVHRTGVSFSDAVSVAGGKIKLPIALEAGSSCHLLTTISSDGDVAEPTRQAFGTALKAAKREARRHIRGLHRVKTSNTAFDQWMARAAADLSLLVTELETGPYPYAGIPWFSVPFGRDAVVTALQVLWINPDLARGVLAYLSALQAAERSSFHDAQPGKIIHEIRKGEMARLQEVPFGRYYGGVDTTPLFVMLAGAYLKRTHDVEFCREVWPAVKQALAWIDNFGDIDGDGFVEYLRGEAGGLQNQGWKDSDNSIFHADGSLAQGAIALVEVQAYVVAAKRAAADIAAAIGEGDGARLRAEADALEKAIDARFWCEEIGTYAIALDGEKRVCAVSSSNAGHVLFCGVADRAKANRVARALMRSASFSGWGVRTVSSDAPLYNPMSYHNGSIWPHDCSIVAMGLSRYGIGADVARIFTGLFDAACRFPDRRLPELFCGFARHEGEGPVGYPSACTPQAWASGAVFFLLQASLGLQLDAEQHAVVTGTPHLPDWLDYVEVKDLALGDGHRATLRFERRGEGVDVQIDGNVRLVKQSAGI